MKLQALAIAIVSCSCASPALAAYYRVAVASSVENTEVALVHNSEVALLQSVGPAIDCTDYDHTVFQVSYDNYTLKVSQTEISNAKGIFRFKGWFTKGSDNWSSEEAFSVDEATKCLTEESEISYGEISKNAATCKLGQANTIPTIVAKYIPIFDVQVAVTPEGAGSAEKNQDDEYEEGATVKLTAKANDGFHFDRWELKGVTKSTENPWSFEAGTGCAGTYTAVFHANLSYQVTFDANGGDTPVPASVCVTNGLPYGPLAVCERTGFDFAGWHTEDGAKVEPTTIVALSAAQRLVAHWSAKSYTVTFNRMGGSSGPDSLFVKYGEKPDNISCPTLTDYLFAGYKMGDELLWDSKGQYQGEAWNVASNVTVVAAWTKVKQRVYFYVDPNLGKVFMDDKELSDSSCEYFVGKKFGILPIVRCASPMAEFVGWLDEATDKLVDPEDLVLAKDMILFDAVITNAPYFVAFDGNGGTPADAMPVAAFRFNEPASLPPVAFAKTGYWFSHWTNAVDRTTYTDEQEVVNLLATRASETNTLFAVWSNNAYTVAFEVDGTKGRLGEGVPSELDARYDEDVELPSCVAASELWAFAGWSNAVSHVVYDVETKTVRNLTSERDGKVQLMALWKSNLGPFSEAMGCDKLVWHADSEKWIIEEFIGHNDLPPCVKSKAADTSNPLYAIVQTNGVLKFWYKPSTMNEVLQLSAFVYESDGTIIKRVGAAMTISTNTTSWSQISWDVPYETPSAEQNIRICISHRKGDGAVCIDDMEWIPEGSAEPKYAETDTAVSSFSLSGGKLVFDFGDDGGVYHLLGTNDVTAPWPWPFKGEIKSGDEIPIEDGEKQMFYRIRAFR